ncbi:metal ABC transporter permease [Aerococcaceae bacterium zg-B36]|uniref:metal ABC transporter permease n=1 Tax=Aerococcaceae bacterium zg-252 TaxID=2796928 RepID=UPI001BD86127|nr:metal ABC transporter permease [Aerococcaceae bacterium zg-B36]
MEMFQYEFIQRAFLAGGAISLITPILGLLLILRRQSLLADTLAHISLAGVALGMMLQVSPTYSTLVVVVIASIIIEYLRMVYRDFSEISVALMTATGMAVALVLVSLNTNAANFRIEQYLFGSIILITDQEVRLLMLLAVLMLVLYIMFRRPLYVLTFDEATAKTAGLPVKMMSIIFSVVTGIAISIMMPIVGSLLVSALIVIPSATAIKISNSFAKTIVIGIFINLVGIFLGLTMSYRFDTPPGASITLCFVIIFIIVSGISRLKTMMRK